MGFSSGTAFLGDLDSLQLGYTMGIRGSINLGNRFKIVGETQFLGSNYRVDSFSRGINIPFMSPPTANDRLETIKVKQSAWQLALGVRYDILRSRLRPYVGVGVAGVIAFDKKFMFQFMNTASQKLTRIPARNREKEEYESYVRFNTGFLYPISKKINVQLEGSYDAPFSHRHDYDPAIWQLKGAVLYRF